MKRIIAWVLIAFLVLGVCAMFFTSCAMKPGTNYAKENTQMNFHDHTDSQIEKMDFSHEPESVIYLAGGCFWGIEHLMQSMPGVLTATSGYANGSGAAQANYKDVCAKETGFRETVRVEYDPSKISLDALLLAYFYVIDPTSVNRQGNDVGSQYQAGVYYTNDAAKEVVERIADIERARTDGFAVEIGPLFNFYEAEDYHQDYL